jgi:hypothetical protein
MTLSPAGTARAVNAHSIVLASPSKPTQRSFRISLTISSEARRSLDLSIKSLSSCSSTACQTVCAPLDAGLRRECLQDLSQMMAKLALRA